MSQARIDGLALEGEHAEDALVYAPERVLANEAFETLDAERELADGEGRFTESPRERRRSMCSGIEYSIP